MAENRFALVADRDSGPYFAALTAGRLELQHCRDCGRWTWPARPICSGCQSENLVFEPVKGTGEVHSWIVTHQVYAPDFATMVPYTVALVRIDEQDDIMIPALLASDVEVRQGLRVRAGTEPVGDAARLRWIAEK